MGMVGYGVGILNLIPSGSNPTPVPVGVLQEVSIDLGYEQKELYGAKAFPVDVANGKGKIMGKAKFGHISPGVIAAVLGGSTTSTGRKIGIADETATIPGTPYKVTVAQGATFFENLGVFDTTTGKFMARGATATGTGVYAVNDTTGEYTFHSSDTTHAVLISYAYTVSGTGKTVTLANQLMGAATLFTVTLHNGYRSKYFSLRLNAVTIPKLAYTFKNDDHTIGDLEFQAFADSSGNVATAGMEDE